MKVKKNYVLWELASTLENAYLKKLKAYEGIRFYATFEKHKRRGLRAQREDTNKG